MSSPFDNLARTLATPMPRRQALRAISAALLVGAFPALRPDRALGYSGHVQARTAKPVRCFVTRPIGESDSKGRRPTVI